MNETQPVAEHPVFRLIYRSRDLIPEDGRNTDLANLFAGARAKNKKLQITGALLLSQSSFAQVLEGEESAVQSLFTRIEQDPRHDSVMVIDAQTVHGRVFGRWSMAQVSDDGQSDVPLIAHADGIAQASRWGVTPEQELVLDLMRGTVSSR